MIQLFKSKVYAAVTLGHLTIDVFNNSGSVLVAFFSKQASWAVWQYGLAVGAYQLFSALAQPLFGWLADKVGSRWLGPGSVAWTISFMVLAVAVAQQTGNFWLFLMPFVLASIGSSAFHPLGTKHAAEEAALLAATGTAVFFLFGQTGLAAGPFLAGFILDKIGVIGLYVLGLVGIPLAIFMTVAMRHTLPETASELQPSRSTSPAVRKTVEWSTISVLAVLVAMRSWAFLGTVTFLPKLFQEMGWQATGYGLITTTYWMASALAGVVAGRFADRYGRRQVLSITLLAGSIPLYFLPVASGWQAFPLAILVGGLLGASHSILVVIAQSVLPGKKAFASGVTLGYLFGSGAIAAWIIGSLANSWGLAPVIQAGTLAGLAAAGLSWLLPATRHAVDEPQPERVPARP
ncbi:MAG: Fosmidomycin resistance protein [Anaerolineae bacterium]|nr:Fosmidomycin resistance protein [Anaerolineae bacterium]